MRTATRIYRFGPFELDLDLNQLRRDGHAVKMAFRHLDILAFLIAHPAVVVDKETLIKIGWRGAFVSDWSLFQAIKQLRRELGTQDNGQSYIDTCHGQGYRFNAPVEQVEYVSDGSRNGLVDAVAATAATDAEVARLADPFRAFIDGRAALETLDRDAIRGAREAFGQLVRIDSRVVPAHIGLANASFLLFEATRADGAPDNELLAEAECHARASVRVDPESADAWSTLACVLYRTDPNSGPSPRIEAVPAARRAVTLEPAEWRHHLRLAFVGWGMERLHAANKALSLRRDLALAHWLAATVFIARGGFDKALDHLRAGCTAQDHANNRFKPVGLHLLHGLVLAASDPPDLDAAFDQFERELSFDESRHIYGRECAANTWYSMAALHLRAGRGDQAAAACREALTRVPSHPLAKLALAAAAGKAVRAPAANATLAAIALALNGQHDAAAARCANALSRAEPGDDGWILPIEPLLDVSRHRDVWADALNVLLDRAS